MGIRLALVGITGGLFSFLYWTEHLKVRSPEVSGRYLELSFWKTQWNRSLDGMFGTLKNLFH